MSNCEQLLRCPVTGQRLARQGDELVAEDGRHRYRVTASGIPLFSDAHLSEEGRIQQRHYDRIAGAYLTNLQQPHTQEYMAYLDATFLATVPAGSLGTVVEVCCGAGEAFDLLSGRIEAGIGLDVSRVMLEAARLRHPGETCLFVQGDATAMPIADSSVDTVVLLGGIHHVNDRVRLFSETSRILKPRGCLCWREPVDDFFLWRWLRRAVYRLSPTLDPDTEHPLRKRSTFESLEAAGFAVQTWRTFGFFGYCFLMNSDVLVFARAWRYMPGVRAFTRAMAWIDGATLRLPGLADAGLVAVGVARKR
jgi:ubiquinone/menaquinone biosynthesis C-methylase UbiE